ncbi:septum formation initiator family protein [Anaerocolumna sp. AGMB13020]|uniref:septum formation initiator family protein n=1 Tax=Anaerocolumna sp. AGMB13020 TaxID=3081750 RepID=UPI00295440A5|nr:septum formation initiator family protein [Anaerocolumna sp. AGMB13020]WOO36504.1 septum formation initiator family protein [Anaerocolumna sp. AGMB13020]
MEENKRKYTRQDSYYDGNAVRKLQYATEPDDDREEIRNVPKVKPKPAVRRRAKGRPVMNLFSVFFLTAAIGITVYTCIGYLNVQTQITQKQNEIALLERDLAKLKNDNDANLAKIDTSINLKYIYEYATGKLGMVYPDDSQVILYESNVSDYVKQYKDIPKAEDDSLFGKLKK